MGCCVGHVEPPPVDSHSDVEEKEDYGLRCVIVGEPGVGKTSLMIRVVEDSFNDKMKLKEDIEKAIVKKKNIIK